MVAATDMGFQVGWTSLGQDGSGPGVFSRSVTLDADLGLEFQANEYTTGAQETPHIASLQDGGFVNRVRVFDADGTQLADVPVSLFGGFTSVGDLAHASSNPRDFLVVWRQDDAVMGRRLVDLVFADDFESADPSAWSETVP